MDICFLGTGSGTEPIDGFRHTSFAISSGGKVFWFDTGENSAYSAHLKGIDLLSTRAVFISHAHMDHIGGLPNLLWYIRKLNIIQQPLSKFSGKSVDIFVPDPRLMPAIRQLLSCTEGGFKIDFTINEKLIADGIVFNEEGVRVRALHNQHISPSEGRWLSYSYRFECEDKVLVYSGDIMNVEELDPLLEGADMLLIETGHHSAEKICRHFKDNPDFSGQLGFIHHGTAILRDFEGEFKKARAIFGDKVFFFRDGDLFKL